MTITQNTSGTLTVHGYSFISMMRIIHIIILCIITSTFYEYLLVYFCINTAHVFKSILIIQSRCLLNEFIVIAGTQSLQRADVVINIPTVNGE